MQTTGYLYAITPGLKEIHGQSVREAIQRQNTFFNTQPYLAPTVMGITINLKEQGQTALIPKLLPSISGSLAAIGDTFFWATLKPIFALLCLLAVLFDSPGGIVVALVFCLTWSTSGSWSGGSCRAIAWDRQGLSRSGPLYRWIVRRFSSVLCHSVLVRGSDWLWPRQSSRDREVSSLASSFFWRVSLAGKTRVNSFVIFYGLFIIILIWTIMR